MNIHKNARLTPIGRERLVGQVASGQTPKAAARAAGVCPRIVRKCSPDMPSRAWLVTGSLVAPASPASATPVATVEWIEALRRQQIARDPGVWPATVSRVLRGLGLNRIAALASAEPARRYERRRPGELIHIDIKKLGRFERTGHMITGDRNGQSNNRGIGWAFLHLAVDGHLRLAYSEILPDEKRGSCLRFLFNAPQVFEAAITSWKTVSRALVGESAPLVRTVLCRTVAKTLSMGFEVRRWSQCSAGKSKKVSRASRSFGQTRHRPGVGPLRRRVGGFALTPVSVFGKKAHGEVPNLQHRG